MRNFWIFFTFALIIISLTSAADFTPQGDINLRNNLNIKNGVDINASEFYGDFFHGDGSNLTGISLSSANSSDYWDSVNTFNTSELEKQSDGNLGILDSFINALIDGRVTQSFVNALFADDLTVDADTTYTAGTNLTLSGTEFSVNMTAVKDYFDLLYQSIGSYLTVAVEKLNVGSNNYLDVNATTGSVEVSLNETRLNETAQSIVNLANDTQTTWADNKFVTYTVLNGTACSGTDKVIGFYNNGTIVCGTDQTGAGGANSTGWFNTQSFGAINDFNTTQHQEYTGGTISINKSWIQAVITAFDYFTQADWNANYTANDEIWRTDTTDGNASSICSGTNLLLGNGTCITYFKDTDTDTTYTNGSGISLVGTQFNHSDTSSQASSDNSGRTYIQDIILDTYGHITGITTATETVTDTTDGNASSICSGDQVLLGNGTCESSSGYGAGSSGVENNSNAFFQELNVSVIYSDDWSNATDLDTTGNVIDDSHNHIYSNIDPFTEANLYSILTDVSQFWESGDSVTGAIGANEAYGSGWNADTSVPEKDDIYDWGVGFDADSDGSLTDETWFDLDNIAGTNEAGLYSLLSDVSLFLESLVDDTNPQLGGYLDTNGNNIGSTTDEIENIYIGDNSRIYFGDGQDASMYWNGTTFIIDT